MLRKFYLLALTACSFAVVTAQTNSEWYSKATLAINQMQYQFKAVDQNRFIALNPANKLAFETTAKKFVVKKIDGNEKLLSFSLMSVNGKQLNTAATHILSHEKSMLSYNLNDVEVQYSNTKEGLRQNFIIPSGNRKLITVSLALDTRYRPALVDGTAMILQDEKGNVIYNYDGLKVWDSRNHPLPAHLELHENNLDIVVDAHDAVFPVTIDPLNHTPDWQDSGNGLLFPLLNDLSLPVLYGFSVSSAGDVNNDGYGDVIVGAPAYVDIINISGGTFNAVSVGAAFIYYGSASGPSAEPNEVLQPTTQAGALFGFSVSKAGDINGDGYDDVVVGAPGDRITLNVGVIPAATSVSAGKVYVYYGGPAGTFDGNRNTEPTVSVTLSLTQPDFGALLSVPVNPLYGYSVSDAGDVNGDGYDDVAVGSPAFLRLLPLALRAGRADVYLGSSTGLATTPATKITGSVLNELFGFSVSTAGNVNGDLRSGRPVSDLIVGAPSDLSILSTGKAYIFHGSNSGITATSSSAANTTLSNGALLSTLFGYSVSNAGDVNNDGYADVIIGEPGSTETLLLQTAAIGAAHIFYGASSGVQSAGSTKLTSPRSPSILGILQGNILFGYSVSGAGDVNCDGFADVIVGEPGGTSLSLGSGLLGLVTANVLSGQAYVFPGRPGGPLNAPSYTVKETGSLSVANLVGHSVSDGGDYNGDGKADILVGAPNGTMDFSGGIIQVVGTALRIITTNSIGSSYGYNGCLAPVVTLPVTITSFTAQKNPRGVKVSWHTEQEVNVNNYEVQWSADGYNFKPVSIVFPAQNTYDFVHANAGKVNFYRLKIIDTDGSFKYSGIAMVKFEDAGKAVIAIAPNPAREKYTISVDGLNQGNYQLRICNAWGQVVQRVQVSVGENGFAQQQMSRNGLTAGNYFVQVYNNAGALVKTAYLIIQ